MEKSKIDFDLMPPKDILCRILIKDKILFKKEVRSKIDKYKKDFPVYFFGNLFINILLIVLMASIFIFIAIFYPIFSIDKQDASGFFGQLFGFGVFSFVVISSILKITTKGFSRNLRIINNIRKGNYDFEIEDHEMDNFVEFVEDLPMKKEEADRLKISLSFKELIEVAEAVNIISCADDIYAVDIYFRNDNRRNIEEVFLEKNNY